MIIFLKQERSKNSIAGKQWKKSSVGSPPWRSGKWGPATPSGAALLFLAQYLYVFSNAITIRRDWFDGTSMRWESGALVFRASLCSLRSVGDDLVVNCDQSKSSSAVRHDEFWFITPIGDEWWIWWIWRGRSDERIHHSSVMNKIHRNFVLNYCVEFEVNVCECWVRCDGSGASLTLLRWLLWASLDDLLSFSLHLCSLICGDVTPVYFTFQRVPLVQAWVSFTLWVPVDIDARSAADDLSSSHEVMTPNSTWLSLNCKLFDLFLVEFYFDSSILSALTQNPRTVRSWTSIHTWIIL